MGSSLRKPVAVNSWDSLVEEAHRLSESAERICVHARYGKAFLEDRMRSIKSQSLFLKYLLYNHPSSSNQKKCLPPNTNHQWIEQWWNTMEMHFAAFADILRLHSKNLESVLEEPLIT